MPNGRRSASCTGDRRPDVSNACALCKEAEVHYRYTEIDTRASLCCGCARAVAHAYSMAHGGDWLPWERPARTGRSKPKIPQPLRWEVFKRDGYTCGECGSREDLTCDHIEAESKGGPTTLENLRTLCRSCNSKKGAR